MKTRGVEQGTLVDGKNLCLSCRNATVLRGYTEKDQIIKCCYLDQGYLKFNVLECSEYSDKTKPSRHDMYQIAWPLVTNKAKNSIGFISPQEFNKNKGSYERLGLKDWEE